MPESRRRLAAIMFTDMVGYSAFAQRDERAAIEALDRHNALLRPVFGRYHGREVKTIGDAFLVEFGSALDAVRCAMEIQRLLAGPGGPSPPVPPIQVRIGIHVGDIVESGNDVLGDAVNIASRIEPLAEPGGICISQQVFDQVQNKIAAPFVRLPPVTLKNIRVPTTVYRVGGLQRTPIAPGPNAPPSADRHLAVLPLANISLDPHDEYFADGLTEELISVLSQVRGLSVIARTSVLPYKAAPKPIAQVGEELGVDVVLEGSVRKSGNQVRVALQLIDARTQSHLWTGRIDRELNDVFEVQSYVASRAARALKLTLTRTGRSARRASAVPNPRWGLVTTGDAYDAYLRGLVAANDSQSQDPTEAFEWFERATRLDPTLADAYAAWANLYVIVAGDSRSMREVMPRAKELARIALELDPGSSDAHSALANIAMQLDNDWPVAESEFRQALTLNPSNVGAYGFFGTLLTALGRLEEAKDAYRQAIRLDPGGHHRHMLAFTEMESGNFEVALDYMNGAHDAHSEHLQHRAHVGMLFLAAGRRDEAERALGASPEPATEDERFDVGLLEALLGRPERARSLLAEFERGAQKEYTSLAHAAMLYSVTGDSDRALGALDQDTRTGDRVLWLFYRGVYFDPISNEPRFAALLRSMGLPDSQTDRRRILAR